MRAKQLEGLIVGLTGYPAREVDERMRPLREHNIIPHGPRGRHAHDITPEHAAAMLLSLVSRRAVDAWPVAETLSRLEEVPAPPEKTRLGGSLLHGVIAHYLKNPEDWTMPRIEATEDGRLAWVYLVGRTPVLFTNDADIRRGAAQDNRAYEAQRGSVAERRFVFGRGFLSQVGLSLQASSSGHLNRDVE